MKCTIMSWMLQTAKKYVQGTSDFNDALANLYGDEEVRSFLNDLEVDYGFDPSSWSKKLSAARDAYVELRAAYESLVDWCLDPNASYSTYMDISQDKYDAFINAYSRFESIAPEYPK